MLVCALCRRVSIVLNETFEKLVTFVFVSRNALNEVPLILILAVFDLDHAKYLLFQKLIVGDEIL